MPEKDPVFSGAAGSSPDICRDFLRHVCKRGRRCKFHHPETTEASEPGSSADEHAAAEVPACRDHLTGDCQRGAKCRFRHGEVHEPTPRRFDPADESASWAAKRRRLESLRFDLYDYGAPRPFPVDYHYLEEENLMLRKRVEELKKQASNLMATNEILLEQNALYRHQPKVVTLASSVAEPSLAPPTVAAVTAYNHTVVQTHNSLSSQPRQELVAPAGGAPPPPGPHLTPELALAQTIAQSMATPASMAPVTVSLTQAMPGITVSHATTPMVSYAIASQSMRITPMPH
ncbi:zinc finger CCCH domain-containing protein 10-like [Narcine bancroftii]|uniref:zinc finger CCCH domain-containing protein 10-like n=1 Tax=Narcine bancroftii TaxID=1343680 RepID=UPI003832253C